MNANCDPILEMRLSQQQLKEVFERNKHLAMINPGHRIGLSESYLKDGSAFAREPLPKPSKYRNVKVEYEGMRFDSKHELQCWKNLKLREKAGEIGQLHRQVSFPLVVSGVHIGKFTADFVWIENRSQVVADAKSPPTRKETAYRLRKKLFEAIFAPLVIREL